MAAKTPIYRSIAWGLVLVQVLIAATLAGLGAFVFREYDPFVGIAVGAACYVLFYKLSRRLLVNDHLQGIALVRRGDFGDAVSHFEASYAFLSDHPWVDQWRGVILGSASSLPYREAALCNAGFCCSQIGEGERAMGCYERALEEFPDSVLAINALNMMRSAQQVSRSSSN